MSKYKALEELLDWHNQWITNPVHQLEPFNWYGAVKAMLVMKEPQKPFHVLGPQEAGDLECSECTFKHKDMGVMTAHQVAHAALKASDYRVGGKVTDEPPTPAQASPEEPEWEVAWIDNQDKEDIKILLNGTPKPQAEAIKEAIEALMEYIYMPRHDTGTPQWQNLTIGIDKARTLIQRSKDNG